jgi:uncharacterized membrane-anchored protein YjiN (DUF445 family)
VRDAELAARVEAAKRELLNTPAVVTLLDDLAASLRRTLLVDLAAEHSEAVTWIATRLERARQALVSDATLRVEIAGWIRTRVAELVERYHGQIARFIENGVRALGPEGAVRLIEEHAGSSINRTATTSSTSASTAPWSAVSRAARSTASISCCVCSDRGRGTRLSTRRGTEQS